MKNYIVSVNLSFTVVTDVMANNAEQAYKKIEKQITEKKLMEGLSKIKLDDGDKFNTFNDITDLDVTEDFVEEGD